MVFRAKHKRLQKTVVLKKLIGKRTDIQKCRTEVDILKNLRHSYLPQVLDFIVSSEGIYTVMDFIPGKSLRQLREEGHIFTEKEVLKYTIQLCEALEYLHSQKPPIIHGDIKPDNIMITPEGNVCLIDFNISGILEGKGAQTFGYTPGYSAPEQVEAFEEIRRRMQAMNQMELTEGETVTIILDPNTKTLLLSREEDTMPLHLNEERIVRENVLGAQKAPANVIIIDKRSDIFSLGATIYTLLTGKLYDMTLPLAERAGVSEEFRIVLAKAVEKNPDKRYQDAGEMRNAILQMGKKEKRLSSRHKVILVVLCIFLTSSSCLLLEEAFKNNRNQASAEQDIAGQETEEPLEVISQYKMITVPPIESNILDASVIIPNTISEGKVDISAYTEVTDSIEFEAQTNKYSFTVPTDGRYRFEISGLINDASVALYMTNILGETIAADTYCTSGKGITVQKLIAGEIYNIQVHQNSGFSTYTLSIGKQKETVDVEVDCFVSDRIEFTDQWNVYSLYSQVSGSITMTISGMKNGTSVALYVMNSLGETIVSDTYCTNGEEVTIPNVLPREHYEIQVRQKTGTSAYALMIN